MWSDDQRQHRQLFKDWLFCGVFFFVFVLVEDEQKNNPVIWRDVGQVCLIP